MDEFRLRPPKIQLSENDVEKAVLDVLRLRGHYPLRQQSGLFKTPGRQTRFIHVGEVGIPDYAIPKYFVEVKRPGGRLSEVQSRKIALLKQHWHLDTAVVESIDELIEWLAQHAF